MTDIAQMMRAANPVPDAAAALPEAELDALLALTETRSGAMSTDQLERRVVEPQRPKYKRNPWLVAAAAFAAVLIVGVAWAVFANLGAEADVVDPPPTTIELLGPDDRPETSATAVLGADPATETYFARSDDDFDSAVMGVEPGTVTAEWYRAEGFLVVFYEGLDTSVTDGLCPMARVEGGGSDFMANASAPGADCSAIVINELPDPAVRTLQCGNSLAFRTAIPEDTGGTLLTALERQAVTSAGSTRAFMGIAGSTDVIAGSLPEVDLALFEC